MKVEATRALAALVVALSLAGCVGTEEPPEDVVETGACPDEGCAGCQADGSCGAQEPLPAGPPPLPAVVTTPFEFTGNTGGSVCPPPVVRSHCVTLQESRVDAPELQGERPLAVHANVTWSASTPATETFYVSILVDQGEGWEWDPETSPHLEGTSPVVVDWDLSRYPAGAKFLLYFECYQAAPAGSVALPQDFAVSGAFVHATA